MNSNSNGLKEHAAEIFSTDWGEQASMQDVKEISDNINVIMCRLWHYTLSSCWSI